METNHVQTENGQTTRNGQADFTDGQRAPHTSWGQVDNAKCSYRVHGGMESNHVQTEDGQTM